jgi:FtsP/CotA-like multicopper oxidase with cupredoxin domain
MTRLDRRRFLGLLGLGGAGVAAGVAVAGVRGSAPETSVADAASFDHAAHVADASDLQHARMLSATGSRSIFPPFPGPAGAPGQLDALLYPPSAEPAEPGRVRELTLTMKAATIEVARETFFEAWTFNGTVPGPIIRVTEGDLLRVTLRNEGLDPHSIHWHGVHPAGQDGVFEPVPAGEEITYELIAEPFGCYPYHCHMEPLDQHIARGLYGAMIVDPPTPRPPAKELVMVLNGFDLNQDGENEIYTVNGIGNYHVEYPIQIRRDELVRIYVVNMTEFDAVNSLHIHANMFNVYRSGTSLVPHELTDLVTLGIAERAILEFRYKFAGRFMFHAHQTELSKLGWMGFFDVVD